MTSSFKSALWIATSEANKWLLHRSFDSQSVLYFDGSSYTYIFKSSKAPVYQQISQSVHTHNAMGNINSR